MWANVERFADRRRRAGVAGGAGGVGGMSVGTIDSMAAYLFETEEHGALRAQVRRFAERAIAPHGAAWEEDEEFPVALYKAAGEAGLTGIGYPEEVGGAGGDFTHTLVAADEIILA